MWERTAGESVVAMISVTEDLQEIKTFVGLVADLERRLDAEKQAQAHILALYNISIAELEKQIGAAQKTLTETSERLDRTFAGLYQAPAVDTAKTTKGKKASLAAAREEIKGAGETMDVPGAQSGERVIETDEGVTIAFSPAVEAFEALCFVKPEPEEETPAGPGFEPLPEPFGECELCQGWGVIDGELYGEFALVPCTCEAGKKVEAGGDQDENQAADAQLEVCPGARACSDYAEFVANPGTQYPPPAALVGIPCYLCGRQRPANCTGCAYRFDCELDPETLDCREVQAGIEEMKTKIKNGTMPGPGTGLDDDEGWPELPGAKSEQTEPEEIVTVTAPEPSPLQIKCPHPKPFRKEIEGVGIVCEVCKLVLEPVTVIENGDYVGDSAPHAKHPDCCKPQSRRSDVDEATGNRVLSCVHCGEIHRVQDKDGKDLPLDSQGVPWEETSDMAAEARGGKIRSKKKTNAQE